MMKGEQGQDKREGMYNSDEINGAAGCCLHNWWVRTRAVEINKAICSHSACCRHQNAALVSHICVVRIFLCTHTYTHMHIFIYMCMCTCTCICVYMNVYTYICTRMYRYVHASSFGCYLSSGHRSQSSKKTAYSIYSLPNSTCSAEITLLCVLRMCVGGRVSEKEKEREKVRVCGLSLCWWVARFSSFLSFFGCETQTWSGIWTQETGPNRC